MIKFNYMYIFKKSLNTSKSHMQIFNVSITTMQGLTNVSLKVREEFIPQSRCRLYKACWKLHVDFSKKCPNIPKCHMHIFNVSITIVQDLKNVA
jgi:hypothetical protein